MVDGTSEQLEPALWLPIMEYSQKTGLSLSTVRRQIKSKRITYRLERGKYFILFDGIVPTPTPTLEVHYPNGHTLNSSNNGPGHSSGSRKLETLETELQKLREELSELKMLVSLLEERMDSR